MESILFSNHFKNKRVLITGGCGFIGSHLANRLLSYGAKVFIMCRNKNTFRYKTEEKFSDIKFFNIDIIDSISVDKCVKEIVPDYVFHLAAYGVDFKQQEYVTAANVNIIGIINLLNSLKDIKCEKFINIGSCAEYGDIDEVIFENTELNPVNIYGSTKASATIIAHQIARENDINIVTLRPFGIFGEGEERHKLFCHVILSILEDKDVNLTLGEQCRDYCYVENIIDGLILAAENKKVKNEIFNIGTGESFSIRYYIDLIFKNMKTEKKPNWGAVQYRKNEMWNPHPDINKIKSILNWRPRIHIEEGIKKTIHWFNENKDLYI